MKYIKHTAPFLLWGIVVIVLLFASSSASGVSPRGLASHPNSQTLAVLTPDAGFAGVGGGDIETMESALVATSGPTGISGDRQYTPTSDQVSLYVVQEGDTLGHIAELFDVSASTIRWTNDISVKGTIRPGQVLTILPISSVQHTVVSGDTLASIAKKYEGDLEETAIFNGLETNAKLTVGETILVPGGNLHSPAPEAPKKETPKVAEKPKETQAAPVVSQNGSYFKRAWGGVVTQGFHGAYRAIDYGMPTGSTLGAAAGGTVVAAKSPSKWNGGYGGMVVIQHNNGAQTLYAHMSRLDVSVGQTVSQGQTIGLSGNTGRSTGPHLHFEIRGWGDVPSHMR